MPITPEDTAKYSDEALKEIFGKGRSKKKKAATKKEVTNQLIRSLRK